MSIKEILCRVFSDGYDFGESNILTQKIEDRDTINQALSSLKAEFHKMVPKKEEYKHHGGKASPYFGLCHKIKGFNKAIDDLHSNIDEKMK